MKKQGQKEKPQVSATTPKEIYKYLSGGNSSNATG